MSPRDCNWLILTITICLCIIVMGGIVVDRTVKDQNYHEPSPQEAAVSAFKDCIDHGNSLISAEEGRAQVEACTKITGQTPPPTTPSVTPGAKK